MASRLLNKAIVYSGDYRHEFIMPEHLLLVMATDDFNFCTAIGTFCPAGTLKERLEEYLKGVETISWDIDYEPVASQQLSKVIETAVQSVVSSNAEALDVPHLVKGILSLEDSWAAYLLKDCLHGHEAEFMSNLISNYEYDELFHVPDDYYNEAEGASDKAAWKQLVTCMNDLYEKHNPLIGREQELQRTIQVLCRRDKNNQIGRAHV